MGVRHDTGATERLTYAELFDEASRVAAALSALTPAGGLVALWAPNVIEWPIIQYGAALAGMVLVALNPVLRDEELEYALSHSGQRCCCMRRPAATIRWVRWRGGCVRGCRSCDESR